MPVVPVNYLAVLVCGIAAMALGWAWYGPLFGKIWASLMGWSDEQMKHMMEDPAMRSKMMRSYALMFIGALVMAFVLDHAVVFAEHYLGWNGAGGGAAVGALNWLGFIAPVTLGTVLWEGKSWKLWTLNNAYWLVLLVIFGAILSVWM